MSQNTRGHPLSSINSLDTGHRNPARSLHDHLHMRRFRNPSQPVGVKRLERRKWMYAVSLPFSPGSLEQVLFVVVGQAVDTPGSSPHSLLLPAPGQRAPPELPHAAAPCSAPSSRFSLFYDTPGPGRFCPPSQVPDLVVTSQTLLVLHIKCPS